MIVQVESDDDSFAMGLDIETGQHALEARSTPPGDVDLARRAARHGRRGEDLVLLQSGKGLAAVHPKTGEVGVELR